MGGVTSALGDEVAVPGSGGPGSGLARRRGRKGWTGWDLIEVAIAVAAFAVLCVVVLRTAAYLAEPDDRAYQASVVAMSDGHFLTLSPAQVSALAAQLGGPGGGLMPRGPGAPGVAQWVQLPDGRWISEKNPGFPFLAVPFQELGVIRWAQLFYGALACVALFAGARRWLGRFGGAAAVGLYCSSGAALLFAWREYMPTFTDASLIAAGTGALLWAVLAVEAPARRRTWAGLAGFVALEAATFTRYTDIAVLGVAVVAVVVAWRSRAARLPAATLAWWLGSVAVLGVGVALFDGAVYGGPLQTGYRHPGEIRFALSAVLPNLRYMPAHLIQAMPMLVLALAALVWIAWRWLRLRRPGGVSGAGPGVPAGAGATIGSGQGADPACAARRDFAVALALAGSWFAVWGLYAAYTWTAGPIGLSLPVVRFYVPALGAISLLGAWLVTRVPRRRSMPAAAALATAAVVAAMFVLGDQAFHQMLAAWRPVMIPSHGPAIPGAPRRAARVAALPPPSSPGQPARWPASRL